MRARIILIDREGDSGPIEVKIANKNNGVRDDKSPAVLVQQQLIAVMGIMNSPLGQAFGITLACYQSQLAALAAQQKADDDED